MVKVFIDGSSGTTGLRIHERLLVRKDIELLSIEESKRKDINARREALCSADIAFLCLPDAAAIEAVALIDNHTAVIDTSTAHRTCEGWVYGMPELCGKREQIRASKRIANPGCHASGFISLVAPLVECGILEKDAMLSCFSLTGYSGGGKKMIAEYEKSERPSGFDSPRIYGISQQHKHLKEMTAVCGLENEPAFSPIVAPFYSGMAVTVSVFANQIKGSVKDVKACYREYYKHGLIRFEERVDEDGFICSNGLSGKDCMEVTVTGNNDRLVLISRFDNLGKGASGAAIQNMNILLGVDEETGLEV